MVILVRIGQIRQSDELTHIMIWVNSLAREEGFQWGIENSESLARPLGALRTRRVSTTPPSAQLTRTHSGFHNEGTLPDVVPTVPKVERICRRRLPRVFWLLVCFGL